MDQNKKIQVIFEPGCFDDFEGTQEELDEFVAEIQRMAESGELFGASEAVDIDELAKQDPELADTLRESLNGPSHTLH